MAMVLSLLTGCVTERVIERTVVVQGDGGAGGSGGVPDEPEQTTTATGTGGMGGSVIGGQGGAGGVEPECIVDADCADEALALGPAPIYRGFCLTPLGTCLVVGPYECAHDRPCPNEECGGTRCVIENGASFCEDVPPDEVVWHPGFCSLPDGSTGVCNSAGYCQP